MAGSELYKEAGKKEEIEYAWLIYGDNIKDISVVDGSLDF